MKCPFCGHEDTQVKDSRPSDDGRAIRRRRECHNCERRFTTFEKFQIQQLIVVKRDGARELFDREKLTKSLLTALRKRPVDQATLRRIVSDIEQSFNEAGMHEIVTADIGKAVLQRLKDLDDVGFVRYASVYNDFKSAEDFLQLIGKAA